MYEFDPRWPDDPRDDDHERDLSRGSHGRSDSRDREPGDPRDVFMIQVYLPRSVRAVAEKGFTDRQARVLVLVTRHSGVCVMRQYSAFAGIVFGEDPEVLREARAPWLRLDVRLRAQPAICS